MYYDALTALGSEYKVDLQDADTQDALMDLAVGGRYDHPMMDVVKTMARQRIQEAVDAIIVARRKIDVDADTKHAKYIKHFDKKLIERARRIQNNKVREEVNKAMVGDARIQNHDDQIKLLMEAMRLLMKDKAQASSQTQATQEEGAPPNANRARAPPNPGPKRHVLVPTL